MGDLQEKRNFNIRREETNMSTSILVTYASSYGSTQEVAEDIAATLRAQGGRSRSATHSRSEETGRL